MGDCCLWAATRWSKGIPFCRCLFETSDLNLGKVRVQWGFQYASKLTGELVNHFSGQSEPMFMPVYSNEAIQDFLPKKQMDQTDRRINSGQKAQILCVTMPSRCHEGVRVLAVEMRKDNSASIRRASQLAQHPEGQVNGCKVPFVSLSRFLKLNN